MIEDPAGRFRSHRSYVEALAWVGGRTPLTSNKKALDRLATRASGAGIASDRGPSSPVDLDQVRRSLRNAWSTELLLGLPGQWTDEDEFIRLTNSWGVIQAYYVGYHVTQALLVAKGNPRPQSHPKTQQAYATLWVDRPVSLAPWTLGAGASGWKNLPSGIQIDSGIHPWSGCDSGSAWSLAAKVLRTTRDDVVKSAREARRDEGQRARKRAWDIEETARQAANRVPRRPKTFARPQLTTAEKTACDSGVRTYTFLDYLWRLRIGANYDDAGVFIDGPDNDADSLLLNQRVVFLAAAMALLAELRIANLVGPSRLQSWADDFIARSIPSPYNIGIKHRRQYL